jgi:iron(III) transport system ATP-binding protein
LNVQVLDIVKRYKRGSSSALQGVSFTANQGEITSLVGASGCGKTTTLRCVAGLETIDSGEIRFDGHLVSNADGFAVPTAKRNVGMVFQSYGLWPHLTVFENVAFGLRTRRVPAPQLEHRVR